MRPRGTSDLPSRTGTVLSWVGAKAGRVEISAASAGLSLLALTFLLRPRGNQQGRKGQAQLLWASPADYNPQKRQTLNT